LEHILTPKGKTMKCAGYRNYDQIDRGEWLVKPTKFDRHTSCLTIKRNDLQNVLLNSIPKEKIIFNSKIISFKESEDKIDVILENNKLIEGSLLIASDGNILNLVRY
jgi:2-polyprenyl-6-methoxyphenol hydroxylase-like FAD-dependent oxidoreductase